MRKQQWFNSNGVLKAKFNDDFDLVEEQLRSIFRQLEGRISYKDLYEVAHQAGVSAVASMVREHVNSKPSRGRK